ncbi:thiamine transport system permease protein [Neisseria sp. HSC-16F19]|nr:iron ABC transporter permease [Neisseria sp. HSC-16F19]MCP2039490.1 thiamine transport system permease protein [Neisseria sp. HSC-16F19]
MSATRTLVFALSACLAVGFLLLMVVAPLAAVGFYDERVAIMEVLGDDYLRWRVVWTLLQALITCVLVAAVGIPLGWALTRFQFAGRRHVLQLLMLPFVMPTLVAGMGVLALFGSRGLLWAGWQDTPYLLLYGNVFFNLPVLVRAVHQGLLQVPAERLWVAQTLGAGPWQRFWRVEWPVLRPWLAGGLCLVFLYCFSGFGLALLLGGSQYATVEVEIYQLIAYELDLAQASVLVWLVLLFTMSAAAAYALLSRRAADPHARHALPPQAPQSVAARIGLAAALLLWGLLCVLPLAAVLWRALLAGASWQVLWDEATVQAAGRTLLFSAAALLLALLLGVCHAALARRQAWARGLIFLPLMVSPVCVAFGLLLLYPAWNASLALLLCTYALLAYPFVAKDVIAAWDALPPQPVQAARVYGASWAQAAWQVTRPLLTPALRRGLALAAATCVGEFAATLFLSRPEWQTLTTLIYQYLGTAGADNYDRAMVLTAVLMLLAALAFAVAEGGERKAHVAMD